MAKTVPAIINAALKRAGRNERFYRSPSGYYYVSDNDTQEGGLYVYSLDPADPADVAQAAEYVQMILNGNDEQAKLYGWEAQPAVKLADYIQ